MRVFERIGWNKDGCAALRWVVISEDGYHDYDYLFLDMQLDLTFDRDSGRRCIICGERADAQREVHEPYCKSHASNICLCIKEGVAKHNCLKDRFPCRKPWWHSSFEFTPYLSIGALDRNIKVGVTNSRRKEIRAAEQGATLMLPLIHKDDYSFGLKDAQKIEDLLSGSAFGYNSLVYGPGKQDFVAQKYLPQPVDDAISFFSADSALAWERLQKAFPRIKAKCQSAIERRLGRNSQEYCLIGDLDCGDPVEPMCANLVDVETIRGITKAEVKRRRTRTGVFGNLVAAKGQLLLLKNNQGYACYRMKDASGMVEGRFRQSHL
nr:DUF2797 domain-containing protein [Candidatus Njordarchaeota archaeon]